MRGRRIKMPVYEFECKKCRKAFEATLSFAEKDKKKVKCPFCSSSSVIQLLSAFFANTSKKS
jgi:putative FmdB family regulatory protein